MQFHTFYIHNNYFFPHNQSVNKSDIDIIALLYNCAPGSRPGAHSKNANPNFRLHYFVNPTLWGTTYFQTPPSRWTKNFFPIISNSDNKSKKSKASKSRIKTTFNIFNLTLCDFYVWTPKRISSRPKVLSKYIMLCNFT